MADEKLIMVLERGSVYPCHVADELGISWVDAKERLERLCDEGYAAKYPNGRFVLTVRR